MKGNFAVLISLLFLFINQVQAGVVIGGTRIIYPADQQEVQVALKNKDNNTRYLVQSWVSRIDDSKAPFIITPPVYKLNENRRTLLHVVYTGGPQTLPQDRESIFIVNVKSVSAISEESRNKNALQLAVKTRIKLFWRPGNLGDSEAKSAWEKLQFQRHGEQLIAKNPTPFYVTFGTLAINGKDIPPPKKDNQPSALTMMLAPFSEQTFVLPAGSHGAVTWSAINDYGTETAQHKQPL
ncbi:TPA: molecular chaperone [Citrobacter gillenii]